MRTVMLLSGGIDSTVALAVAINKGHDCTAISFDYGQTHIRELDSAAFIASHYKISHTIIDLKQIFNPNSALTGATAIPELHATAPDATHVPARNLLMLSVAAAHAENTGSHNVGIGANKDDHAGYIDCRPEFIAALDRATRLGTIHSVGIWTPLIRMPKRDIIQLGNKLGAPLEITWSCYRGGKQPCGRCGACEANQ